MLGHDYESVVESVSFIARDLDIIEKLEILDIFQVLKIPIYLRYIGYLGNLGYWRYLIYLIRGRQIGPKGGEGCYRCLKRLNGHHLSKGVGGLVCPMAVIGSQ